jgi:hydrogenase maturation protease
MNIAQIKEIANAVLYEGYLLYPYRTSAIKNRQRWTVGVVYPRAYSQANGGREPWTMCTECLLWGQETTRLDVSVRFLHLLVRQMSTSSVPDSTDEPSAHLWDTFREPWEKGVEREIAALDLSLHDLLRHPQRREIDFPGTSLQDEPDGQVREQHTIQGTVCVTIEALEKDLFKLCIQIENTTPDTASLSGQQALWQSLISTHTILQVRTGTFISLLDPPEALQAMVQGCRNIQTWPVLVGNEGECNALLSSPVILYDYPQIAPESPGPLFDGTEIDELLTLRILTLTHEEKEQMRQGDERVREILERTEGLSPEQFMRLHGAIRSLKPIEEGEEA